LYDGRHFLRLWFKGQGVRGNNRKPFGTKEDQHDDNDIKDQLAVGRGLKK
jgi:hypothetical protein